MDLKVVITDENVDSLVDIFKLAEDNLFIKQIEVNDGSGLKRMDKSHGARFARGLIQKRHSRLTIILAVSSDTIPEAKKAVESKSLDKINGSKS